MDYTLEDARNHRNVSHYHNGALYVKPRGNCVLFNRLAESDNIHLGNVSTVSNGDLLKVNATAVE